MITLCVCLAALTAFVAALSAYREKQWQKRLLDVTLAAGLKPSEMDKLPARVAGMRESSKELTKEEYLRRLFEAMLNEIRQGVVIVDDHLRIKFANRIAARLFQRQNIQRGRTLLEELQDHQVTDTVQEAMETQRRCVHEIEILSIEDKEGVTNRYYQIEAAPLPAKAERGAWLMIHDVTERTLTEQIRKDFVANASHELRTPLTLINGYIETLQSGMVDDPATLRRCLDIMEKHGKRIVRIIEDLLTISRLENSSLSLNIEPFTVRACVQDSLDHLAPMLEGRDTRIVMNFPPDGGMIRADRFYWDQVFTNLIENSLKENPNPGLIITVTGEWFADHCVLSVSDNGIGIPAHDLPFVFKRFYRGHKHHSPHIKGTGLGLSIVKRAVEAHGGAIELTSIPGVQTTFTMRVPLNDANAAAISSRPEAEMLAA